MFALVSDSEKEELSVLHFLGKGEELGCSAGRSKRASELERSIV